MRGHPLDPRAPRRDQRIIDGYAEGLEHRSGRGKE
jgi:hypothetical protein